MAEEPNKTHIARPRCLMVNDGIRAALAQMSRQATIYGIFRVNLPAPSSLRTCFLAARLPRSKAECRPMPWKLPLDPRRESVPAAPGHSGGVAQADKSSHSARRRVLLAIAGDYRNLQVHASRWRAALVGKCWYCAENAASLRNDEVRARKGYIRLAMQPRQAAQQILGNIRVRARLSLFHLLTNVNLRTGASRRRAKQTAASGRKMSRRVCWGLLGLRRAPFARWKVASACYTRW